MLKKIFVPFYIIAFLHLLSECFYWDIVLWTKPLLMPALAMGLFWGVSISHRALHYIKLTVAALAFSTAGDVLLQLEKSLHQPLCFYFGLGAFLVAQWMYVLTFRNIGLLQISKKWGIAYLIYFLIFLFILYPGMDLALKIPVTIYGLMLTWMAWNSWRVVTRGVFKYIAVIGSILFVASDSILAINKFKFDIPHAGIWIMLTYILAQYFIIEGVLLKTKSE